MVTTSEATAKNINPADESAGAQITVTRKKVAGPQLPPGHQRSVDSDDLSDEGPLTVKMESPTNESQDCGDNSHVRTICLWHANLLCQQSVLCIIKICVNYLIRSLMVN